MRRTIRLVFVLPIRLYQVFLSPSIPSGCNYQPTCSQYTADAIMAYGVIRGFVMGILRIGRCSARYRGGYDPVPERFDPRELLAEYPHRSVRRTRP